MSKIYKVFLVDDDTKTLLLLKDYLEKNCEHRLDIEIYDNGEAALEALKEDVNFVILDYFLDSVNPDAQSGMEVLKAMKDKNRNVEVILMSGQDNMETTLELLRQGAYDYIIKGPTAFARTQLIIDSVIEKQEAVYAVEHYRAGYRYALTAAFLFLLMLIAVILKYYEVY